MRAALPALNPARKQPFNSAPTASRSPTFSSLSGQSMAGNPAILRTATSPALRNYSSRSPTVRGRSTCTPNATTTSATVSTSIWSFALKNVESAGSTWPRTPQSTLLATAYFAFASFPACGSTNRRSSPAISGGSSPCWSKAWRLSSTPHLRNNLWRVCLRPKMPSLSERRSRSLVGLEPQPDFHVDRHFYRVDGLVHLDLQRRFVDFLG